MDFYWQFSYAILLYGLVITQFALRKVSCLLNVEATTLVKAKKMKEGGGWHLQRVLIGENLLSATQLFIFLVLLYQMLLFDQSWISD